MKTPSFVWTAASRSVKRINEENKNGFFFLMELHYDRGEDFIGGFFRKMPIVKSGGRGFSGWTDKACLKR
ncbi:hypothetical protein RG959_18490 [Domibacillus sp. 8LH]|uniref:hypothetical protein n=1 Tax=Domibacillus sp. 8LH TaxID=3073900 RepID=UPI00316F43E9